MKKIYNGMQNAGTIIDENFNELDKKLEEISTGVTYLTGYSDYSSELKVVVTKVGKEVEISGVIRNAEAITNGDIETVMGTIPKEYRPKKDKQQLCQATGSNFYLLRVKTTGEIIMTRHRKGADYAPCNAGSYITVYTNYKTA